MFAAWLIMVSFIPSIWGAAAEANFPGISLDYQTELDNFKILVDFEKKAVEKIGKFNRNNIENARKIIEEYWKDYYKRIEAQENLIKKRMASNIEKIHLAAALSPTGFYLATGNETSGQGYFNYLDFYDYVRKMKRRFVRFYIDRTFYNDPKAMENFIRDNEDIFQGSSRLPGYFGAGVLINLGYVVLLIAIARYRFNRCLFPLPQKKEAFAGLDIKLAMGKIHTLAVEQVEFARQFVNSFFGPSRELYDRLIDLATVTPYKNETIEKLREFDYDFFMKEHSLNGLVFEKVVKLLSKGDVTGCFRAMRGRIAAVESLLEEIKSELSFNRRPPLAALWKLNETCAEACMFGSYTARLFHAINN